MKMKRIKDYPNYFVTSNGDVYSIKRRKKIKYVLSNNGYRKMNLYNLKGRKTFTIHRLVAQAFIPNPQNKLEANHIDEDKTNNRVENLNWMTRLENNNWGTRNKRISKTKTGVPKHKKSYYKNIAKTRRHFKIICNRFGWLISNFEEIYVDTDNYRSKRYNYIYKGDDLV